MSIKGFLGAIVLLSASSFLIMGFDVPTTTKNLKNLTTATPIKTLSGGIYNHEMIFVPAGQFTMGLDGQTALSLCLDDDIEENCTSFDYTPSWEATVNSFWIDTYEVSNAQYRLCVQGKSCPERHSYPDHLSHLKSGDKPVTGVSWYEAAIYCESRNARLPTEIEWEYAARGNQSLLYPWGNQFDPSVVTMYVDQETSSTVEVFNNPEGVSWIGAYNMVGNVSEWVDTRYYPYPLNELPPDTWDLEKYRIIRGGSWGSLTPDELNGYYRITIFRSNNRFYSTGFRCTRSSDPRDN